MKKLFLLTCSLLTLLSCTTDTSNLETKNETFSSLAKKGDEQIVYFSVTPPKKSEEAIAKSIITIKLQLIIRRFLKVILYFFIIKLTS